MDEDGNVELQALLDRLRQGDREARRLLLERACERLRRLAGRMLHGSFPELARRTQSLLEQKTDRPLAADLIKQGRWDPFALVDACEQAAGAKSTQQQVLRAIQAIESHVLLEWLARGSVG